MFKRIGSALMVFAVGAGAGVALADPGCSGCGAPANQRMVDLTIEKTKIAGPDFLAYGDQVTFEVKVENLSDEVARCVRVDDFLPPSLSYVAHRVTDASADKDEDSCCTETEGVLNCEIPKFRKFNANNPNLFVIEIDAVAVPTERRRRLPRVRCGFEFEEACQSQNQAAVSTEDNDVFGPDFAFAGVVVCDVMGTNGPDNLFGTGQDEVICGLGGSDEISGGGGNDCILGGNGADEIHGGPGHDLIAGEGGSDNLFGEGGGDTLLGGPGRDDIDGSDGADTICGGPGADFLIGANGSDRIGGDGGNDKLLGGPGGDFLDGGAGNSDNCSGGGQGGDVEINCEE